MKGRRRASLGLCHPAVSGSSSGAPRVRDCRVRASLGLRHPAVSGFCSGPRGFVVWGRVRGLRPCPQAGGVPRRRLLRCRPPRRLPPGRRGVAGGGVYGTTHRGQVAQDSAPGRPAPCLSQGCHGVWTPCLRRALLGGLCSASAERAFFDFTARATAAAGAGPAGAFASRASWGLPPVPATGGWGCVDTAMAEQCRIRSSFGTTTAPRALSQTPSSAQGGRSCASASHAGCSSGPCLGVISGSGAGGLPARHPRDVPQGSATTPPLIQNDWTKVTHIVTVGSDDESSSARWQSLCTCS